MNIQIIMDNKAQTWLRDKGKELTIQLPKTMGCCIGGPMELQTQLGKPKEITAFEKVTLDDLTLFIEKNLNLKDNTLTLELTGFGWFKSISAEGLRIL
ncbi:MAG: Fe-S oxidoreductase [Bacillaceae bacterium]|nr:Fe-S oxidoreductase [Bacillaceae bacterium]